MGRIQDFLQRMYGFPVAGDTRQQVIGVNPVVIATNNADRVQILVFNLSANNVYVGFNADVNAVAGILLAANGGQIGFNVREDGELSGAPLYAMSAGAGTTIFVSELEALR